MKHLSKTLMATLGLLTALATTPVASASGSLHLNLPGLSIGVHDDHGHKKHRKRYRNRHHNDHYYSNRHERRNSQRYYNQRRSNHYDYNNRRSNRYYNNRRSNNNYYYGGRRNNDRGYYNDSRRVEACPTIGYTPRYDRNRNCYRHKGHFHCSD